MRCPDKRRQGVTTLGEGLRLNWSGRNFRGSRRARRATVSKVKLNGVLRENGPLVSSLGLVRVRKESSLR